MAALSRLLRWRAFFIASSLLLVLGPIALAGEELVWRFDGQLDREGRAQLGVPVLEGQQLTFRVGSLDAGLRLRLSQSGQELSADAEGSVAQLRQVRIRRSGTAQLSIEALSPPSGPASFQVRVFRQKDSPVLNKSSLVRASLSLAPRPEASGRIYDWYPLALARGQRLVVGVVARGDAQLRIEMPDGGVLENDDALGSDARLVIEAGEGGLAWVGAGLLIGEGPREKGDLGYQLYVREFAPATRTLGLGASPMPLPFAVVAEDLPPLPDFQSFTAPRPGVYRFRIEGRDGALPSLRLGLENGRELVDSAARGQRDWALLRCYLRQNQKVELVAESLQAAAKPAYLLAASYEGPGTYLRDGDNLERALADPKQGFFVYRGRAGEYVEFLMTSDDFETRLLAEDALGQLFSWSRYFGSDFAHASLGGYWFDQAGELVLETAGRYPGDDGSYQLSVRSSLSGGVSLPRDPAARLVLQAGVPMYFRVTDRVPAQAGNHAFDLGLDLKPSEVVAVRFQSWDVEARLQVLGPDGGELRASGQASKDGTLEFIANRAGRHSIRYLVPQREGRALNACATVTAELLGVTQALGGDLLARAGELASLGDRQGNTVLAYDLPLRLRSGQRLYLLVEGIEFQPLLRLLDKDGLVLAENAGNGVRNEARLEYLVQKGGAYRLRVQKPAEAGLPAGAPARCVVHAYELR